MHLFIVFAIAQQQCVFVSFDCIVSHSTKNAIHFFKKFLNNTRFFNHCIITQKLYNNCYIIHVMITNVIITYNIITYVIYLYYYAIIKHNMCIILTYARFSNIYIYIQIQYREYIESIR